MITIEWYLLDKSEWPDGPWKSEPDKKQWQDKATGLLCLILRTPYSGHLCGYVGVPEGHPMYGVGDHDIIEIEVHGGLTFSGDYIRHRDPTNHAAIGQLLSHVIEPGDPKTVWWLGFDCAHLFDLIPTRRSRGWVEEERYRDISFVEAECTKLARQLKDV